MTVENYNIINAPKAGKTSYSINPLTTQATLGTVAQQVSESKLAPAATLGSVTLPEENSVKTYIGQYALTPKQLENAGIIKPGSSNLVDSLVASGTDIQKAMPPAIFTGKSGAKDYNSFVRNISAQSDAMVKNLQVAQTSLQNTGLITGAEAPSEINGVVLSAAQNGVSKVLEAINTNKPVLGIDTLNKTPRGQIDKTLQDIQSGNFAGKLAESGLGITGGVETALQGLATTPNTATSVSTGRGAVADAFETIKKSIPNLQPNVPNDLSVYQKEKAQQVQEASLNAANNQLSQIAQGVQTPKILQNEITNPIGQATSFGKLKSFTDSSVGGFTERRLMNRVGSVGSALMALAPASPNQNESTQINQSVSDTMTTSYGEIVMPNILNNPFEATSLQEIAQVTASGILGSTSSALASGLNNLPGSLGAVTSITDFNKGVMPSLPGTDALKADIKTLATNSLNNIETSVLSGAESFLAQSGLDSNQNLDVNSLVDIVSSKLPAGPAALLQNAIGSIASSGLGIKSPSVGVNTVPDRATIASAIKNALGDPAIPEPNYGGVDEEAGGKLEQNEQRRKEFIEKQNELLAELKKATTDYTTKLVAFTAASTALPQGSSITGILKSSYEQAFTEKTNAKNKLDNLKKEYPDQANKNSTSTVQNSTSTTGSNRTLSGSLASGAGGNGNGG